MSIAARLLETLHLFVVGLWLGAIVMAAVVAAIIFPTMRELDPTFAIFSSFTGNHADLGAGFIQAKIFAVADYFQFIGAFVGVVTFIASVLVRRATFQVWSIVRAALLAAALLAFSYQFFILTPRMDINSRGYWAAARAGETERAETFRDAFLADHPTATRTFGLIGALVLASFFAGAWSATAGPGRRAPELE